jgi:hypothetical protein
VLQVRVYKYPSAYKSVNLIMLSRDYDMPPSSSYQFLPSQAYNLTESISPRRREIILMISDDSARMTCHHHRVGPGNDSEPEPELSVPLQQNHWQSEATHSESFGLNDPSIEVLAAEWSVNLNTRTGP